jgi:hypothetical protein
VEVISEKFLKIWKLLLDSKWVVMLIISGISSVMANVSQSYTVTEQQNEIAETRQQVANVANHYTKKQNKRRQIVSEVVIRPHSHGKEVSRQMDDHVEKFH